jgi:hypothetical protein
MFVALTILTALTGTGLYTTSLIMRGLAGYVKPHSNTDASEFDHQDLEGPDDYNQAGLIKTEIPKLARRIAVLARTSLYLTHPAQDQVIQLREWSVREMTKMNVRKIDQSKVLPYIVKLAFLQTREERETRDMSTSDDFIQRFDQTHRTVWTYETPSWEHIFGRFISEVVVTDS